MTSEIRIISFDLDGVLYDGQNASFTIAQSLGLSEKYMALFKKMESVQMTFEELVMEGAQIWKGVAVNGSYDNLVETLPLMTGAEVTVATLKEWDYEVGCISSGVSQFFMAPLTRRLKLDFGFSNVLGSTNGVHDGSISYFMDGPQKAESILKYIEERNYSAQSLASVGNGYNDIDLFKVSDFSIAFNPVGSEVSEAATVTIESKDLRDILPHFKRD